MYYPMPGNLPYMPSPFSGTMPFQLNLQNLQGASLPYLMSLQGGFNSMLGGGGLYPGGVPPMFMPSPMSAFPAMSPLAGMGYAANPAGYGGFESNPYAAGMASNPYEQAAFESAMGGNMMGASPSSIFMQPYMSEGMPYAANPLASLAMSPLALMAGALGLGGLMMHGGHHHGILKMLMLGGLAGMLGGGMLGGGFLAGDILEHGLFGFGGLQSPLGGLGMGSWNPLAMPGRINNTNPLYEQASQMQVASVLQDPSLTVEDKVTLMLMLIMNKMDQDILRQGQYINAIQQQQSNTEGQSGTGGKGKGGKGKGGKGGKGKGKGGLMGGLAGGMLGSNGNSSPSIDVESMKLKRMVDKREQMFDILKSIIDRYNQTAKGLIDSLGGR